MGQLEDLLRREADVLSSEFAKASSLGRGTPQEIAEFRENAFRSFLLRFFAPPYRVVKGKILDTTGIRSDSIDAVVLYPSHPNLVDQQGKYQLILADGVDFVVEVKPDLGDHRELVRGLRQIRSVKSLRRIESPLLLRPTQPEALLEHSLRIPAFLFGLGGCRDWARLAREANRFYRGEGVTPPDQIDHIVLNDLGILSNVRLPQLNRFYPPDGIPPTGWFFEDWGKSTLAAMLLHMNACLGAAPKLTGSVVAKYLKHIVPKRVFRVDIR